LTGALAVNDAGACRLSIDGC